MSDENKIEAFLFDLGNVIIPFDNQIAAEEFARYAEKKPSEIYDVIFDSPIVNEFSDGKIKPTDFFQGIKNIFGLDEEIDYESFKGIWNSIFLEENKDVCGLVKKLLNNDEYKVVLVSNINQIHFEYIEKNYLIVNLIEDKVLSYKVGASKPDDRIYRKALEKANSKPENTVYIDDRIDLIHKANSLDLQAIHFKGYNNLVKELGKYIKL